MLGLILAGCNQEQENVPKSITEDASLIPYATPTSSSTPETQIIIRETSTQQPTPTSTPMVYTIVEGDTMLAIAFKHGISLEELQAANPEVNARLLVVGTDLVIPIGENIPSSPVTATPIPIQVSSIDCHPGTDGIWCFASIKNERSRPLENISARISLHDKSGNFLVEGTAYSSINLLPVGEELPLVAFLPGNYNAEIFATTEILTVQPLPGNDDRYLNAWLEIDQVVISESGERAQVEGRIGLPAKSKPGKLSWILVVAYDQEGNVVGIRKFEQLGTFEPGSSRQFAIEIFSLDQAIDEVRAFVEVRP